MENEKDLLNKDLETMTDAAGLEKLKEDAELLGHEDIVAKAQEKINALSAQAEEIVAQVNAKTERVESTGGSMTDLEEKVAPIQGEIQEMQQETTQELKKIEENSSESKEKDNEFIRVMRTNGEIESDWKPMFEEGNNVVVMKKDPQTGEMLQKSISKFEIASLNPQDERKYLPGEIIKVQRSDGTIETDWRAGEVREVNGNKFVTVYKGNFPPTTGTLKKEIPEEELLQLNTVVDTKQDTTEQVVMVENKELEENKKDINITQNIGTILEKPADLPLEQLLSQEENKLSFPESFSSVAEQQEFLNRYLDLNLIPLDQFKTGSIDDTSFILQDYKRASKYYDLSKGTDTFEQASKELSDTANNNTQLVENQIKTFNKVREAMNAIKSLSKEQRDTLGQTIAIDRNKISDEAIKGIFIPVVPSEKSKGKSLDAFIPADSFYPKEIEWFNNQKKELNPGEFRDYMATNAKTAINVMLLHKKAVEQGII